MFVLTPHPCVLVCVRVCVCVPAAWIVWIASETTLRVLFWAEARGRRPGAGPEKKSTLLFPPPAESTGTQQRAREMRLSSAFVWAVQTSKLWSKKTLFFFFLLFFLYRSRPIPVSCVQLCTGTCTNLYSLRFTRTRDFAEVKRYLVLSCAQSAQLVARHSNSLASPVNIWRAEIQKGEFGTMLWLIVIWRVLLKYTYTTQYS